MTGRLVALGDSFSCGVGVGVAVELEQTWLGLLSSALGLRLELLATPGCASDDVRRTQLSRAIAAQPTTVTLLVGLNDIVRGGFEPAIAFAHVDTIVRQLTARHPAVLVAQLHDAVAWLPLSRSLRERYTGRIAAVNAALDQAIGNYGAIRLDLADIPVLHNRKAWAVDRIHPSRYGHHVMAAAALAALRARGAAPAGIVLAPPVVPARPPTFGSELRWFARHGAPWLVRRLPRAVAGRPSSGQQTGVTAADRLAVGQPRAGSGSAGGKQLVDH